MTSGTAANLRAINSELADQFFERRDVIEALTVAVLAQQHAFILGPPGTAKSALVHALCNRITGAKYWRILMDRQLGKEESFGPIDIPAFEKTGHWGRNITDTLADAHVAFIDEVGKAGPASLNPYLTIFEERMFKPNGSWIQVPLISAIGASNETLEDELSAMWDRFLVRVNVEYLVEPGNFAAMLDTASRPAPANPTSISLADLQHAINVEVPAVSLPPGIVDTILQLRVDLRSKGITPSDRRWKASIRLLQASAYLNDRTVVDDDDLAVLRHVLWDVVEQVAEVERMVLSLTSPMTKAALEFAAMLDEINAEIDSRKGQALEKRSAYGGTAKFKVDEINKNLSKLTEEANRQGRSTAKLDSVRSQVKATRTKIFVECLNVPADKAERMGI